MNLINYLKTYSTVQNPGARFLALLIHMPILLILCVMHAVESVFRLFSGLGLGMIGAVTTALTDAHTFFVSGLGTIGTTVMSVAKGPVKVVKAVEAPVANVVSKVVSEVKTAADNAIQAVVSAEAPMVAAPVVHAPPAPVAPVAPAPVAAAPVVQAPAAPVPFVNGTPIPAPVAPKA